MSDAEQLLARTPDAEALQRTLSKIGELDLKDNLIELETKGYTTVKGVLSEDKIERAKRAILKRVANRGNPESGESGDSVLNSAQIQFNKRGDERIQPWAITSAG